jgi:ribosome hibernation promoting factor
MNITITARKFKAHDTLKDHIENGIKSLTKFNDDIINADVILSYQNNHDSIKIAEIILKVPGQTLAAKEESDDFEKSITSAIEKISRQLIKLKTRRISRVK